MIIASNVGGSGNDRLCFISSCCVYTFSNAVGIPIIIVEIRNDVNTIKFKIEIMNI